jgi:hypothetical protein
MRRLLAGRGLFFLALALLVVSGLPHARYRAISRSYLEGTFRPTPSSLYEGTRAYLTNQGDMERYRAYAQAALGRAYNSFYIRTRAEWEAQFALGEFGDPDGAPEVRPTAPRRPYQDFLVEYPPAFFLIAIPPALVAADLDGYMLAFKLLMACCLVVAALCTERYAQPGGRPWLNWMGGAVLALGVVSTHRFDAAVTLGLCASLWAVARRQLLLGGAFIGAAVAIKGAPLLFIPPVLMYLYCEQGLRSAVKYLLSAGTVVLASIAPVLLSSGWALAEAFDYHRVRPLQIESTLGALLALSRVFSRDFITSVQSFGSVNLAGRPVAAAGAVTSVLMLLGILCSYALTWRRICTAEGLSRRLAVMEGILLTGLAFMVFGKVFSPQYLTWIVPFCVITAVLRGGHRAPALIVLLVMTQVIYPIAYGLLIALEPWVVLLVLLRNLGLAVWAVSLLCVGKSAAETSRLSDTASLSGALASPGLEHPP